MTETSGHLATSGENNKIGPNFFGFYTSEVAELLSQDEDFVPFSRQYSPLVENLYGLGREKGATKSNCTTKEINDVRSSTSLYSNGIGALLSEFKKERLKLLLRQGVSTLSQEVDEMIDPAISICRLRSYLGYKERLLNSNGLSRTIDQPQHPRKKLKVIPSSLGKELSDDDVKKCSQCDATETSQWRSGPDGTKSLCNACRLRFRKDLKRGTILCPNIGADEEYGEIDDDMRFLLENDRTKVEELMNKHADELFTMLEHMEQKLEELLNIVMTSCRSMTLNEKQQLRKLIKNLPPRNIDRVVEILRHSKPSGKDSCNEVYVDLDDEDQVTLWRLYFYVAAVENAKKL